MTEQKVENLNSQKCRWRCMSPIAIPKKKEWLALALSEPHECTEENEILKTSDGLEVARTK